ncbi:hypothetical protein Tco_0465397 [Tanacetum coccineum]
MRGGWLDFGGRYLVIKVVGKGESELWVVLRRWFGKKNRGKWLAPMEDQPLPADASPTTISPGYIADSDLEEDEEDPEEDLADHPADEGDNDDNESSNDDDDDDDVRRMRRTRRRST